MDFVGITKYETTTTQDDIEAGHGGEAELIYEDDQVGFRDMVDIMKTFDYTSQSPVTNPDHCWLLSHETCYTTGDLVTQSLHPSNNARSKRYWAKALKAAGFMKKAP